MQPLHSPSARRAASSCRLSWQRVCMFAAACAEHVLDEVPRLVHALHCHIPAQPTPPATCCANMCSHNQLNVFAGRRQMTPCTSTAVAHGSQATDNLL